MFTLAGVTRILYGALLVDPPSYIPLGQTVALKSGTWTIYKGAVSKHYRDILKLLV